MVKDIVKLSLCVRRTSSGFQGNPVTRYELIYYIKIANCTIPRNNLCGRYKLYLTRERSDGGRGKTRGLESDVGRTNGYRSES